MIRQDLSNSEAVTKDGEVADIIYFLDEEKIAQEAAYDGLYAVCTDLFDDKPESILKVSESRWQIEACFRIMKTNFSARPVYVQREDRIQAHFLVCFLALLIYRLLEKKLEKKYTCENILTTLRNYEFADIQGQALCLFMNPIRLQMLCIKYADLRQITNSLLSEK